SRRSYSREEAAELFLLHLELQPIQRAAHGSPHLRADEQPVGEPGQRAATAKAIVELLCDPGSSPLDREGRAQLTGAPGVAKGNSVQVARLMLEHVLGDLPPPRGYRAPAERPADLGIAVGGQHVSEAVHPGRPATGFEVV